MNYDRIRKIVDEWILRWSPRHVSPSYRDQLGDLVFSTAHAVTEELKPDTVDAVRWRKLVELCGHWQDDSMETVKFSQDDATKTCIIVVGKTQYYGTSFGDAIDKIVAGG